MPASNGDPKSILEKKQAMRREFLDRRNAQGEKELASAKAIARLLATPEYRAARFTMWYVHCRSEMQTKSYLFEEVARANQMGSEKIIVIPYCTEDKRGQNKLGLWHLENPEELVVGKWGILEPPSNRWDQQEKNIEPQLLDLILVPGVSFDLTGARLGNGQGYYDRLLQQVRADCQLFGLCYESQLSEKIPLRAHDVSMDRIFTEKNAYVCEGRQLQR